MSLTCGGGQAGQGYPAVCLRMRAGKPGGGKGALLSEEKSLTLAANSNDQVVFSFNKDKTIVRRLTPKECERLQGLPDDYTLIGDKSCSDSARYKALGNGMAQPCADWIIQRIVEVTEEDKKC